jgi:LmbE family N-acetylglucosaminyl deacetylase
LNIVKLKILIIVAHPDDEVLGMGGTIKKLSKNNEITLCVVSEGASAQYSDKRMIKIRKEACLKSGKILGIKKFYFLDFPDMQLDIIPHLEINKKLEKIIQKIKPEVVFTTPDNDYNKDHQKVYESTLVVTRPLSSNVKEVCCFELPGFTKKAFKPSMYVDVSKEYHSKIKAFKQYKSEVEKFPHPRSLESIENLMIQRGIESGLKKAEAFFIIRKIIN